MGLFETLLADGLLTTAYLLLFMAAREAIFSGMQRLLRSCGLLAMTSLFHVMPLR
jgi:hypothetical protein